MAVAPTELHRIYIQCLLARRVMKQDVALEMYNRAIQVCQIVDRDFQPTHTATAQGLSDFLHEASSILEEVGMTIMTAKEETGSGRTWVTLANTDATDVALMATDYTPIELAYIRAIIENIITSYPANSVGSTRALAVTSEMKSAFSKQQAEMVLASCVSRGWLKRSKRGRYSLAPRSLMELEVYLKEQYDDYMYFCHRCSKIVLTGIKCNAGGCNAHIHESCMNAFKRHRGNNCPACKVSFDEVKPSPLGEKAVSRESDHFRTAPGKSRKRPSNADQQEEEDELDDEDLDELEDEEGMVSSQNQRQTQTQSQGGEPSPRSRRGRNGPTWNTESLTARRKSRVPATQDDE